MLTFPDNRSLVFGIAASIVAVPFALLAGLTISYQWFVLLVVGSVAFVGAVAALLFHLTLAMVGTSRVGASFAGALCGIATCIAFLLAFSMVTSLAGNGPWLKVFLLYADPALWTLFPVSVGLGFVLGWLASARRFTPRNGRAFGRY